MDWYVVNTFSGYENTVKRSLEDRIKGSETIAAFFDEILVPSEQVNERRGKKTIKTNKKILPGYLFVKMELNDETWHLISNTPKVTGFLGGKKPRPVRDAEMQRMLGNTPGGAAAAAAESEEAEAAPVVPDVAYKVGDEVLIKSGAFANFQGEVEEVNADKHKIWVSVSIFGRPTRVEVDFTETEPVVR